MNIATLRKIIRQESPSRIETGTVISADYRGIREVTVRLSGGRTVSRLHICPDKLEPGDQVIVAHLEGLERMVVLGRVLDEYSSNLSRHGILAPPSNFAAIGLPMATMCKWDTYPGEDMPGESLSYIVEESTDGVTGTQVLVTRGSYYIHLCTADDDHDPEGWYFRVRALRWLGDSNVQYSAWSSWAAVSSKTWDKRYYLEDELSSHAAGCGASLIWICDVDENFPSTVSDVELALEYLVEGGAANQHNTLLGLQGGQASQYYHLTAAQHTELAPLGGLGTTGLVARTGAATWVPLSPSQAGEAIVSNAGLGWIADATPSWIGEHTFDGGLAVSAGQGITMADGTWIGSPAAARLGFNSSGAVNVAYFLDSNIGVGHTGSSSRHLSIVDTALDFTTGYTGIYSYHMKTAGATSEADDVYGAWSRIEMNHNGSTIGHLTGIYSLTVLTDGIIGDGQENLTGMNVTTRMNAGTVNNDVFGMYFNVDLNAGVITDDVWGMYLDVDAAAGVTSVGGNVYGARLRVDCNTDPTGVAYVLYLLAADNVDYGIYQSGSAINYFAGNTGIGTTVFGTNATKTLGLANGVAPTTSPANTIQVFSVDCSDAASTLGLRTEQVVEVGAPTPSHKLKVLINGTEYWLSLDAV